MAAFLLSFATLFVAGSASAAETESAVPSGELTVYGAVGFSVAEDLHLRELNWTPEQFEAFLAGLRASFEGTPFPIDAKAVNQLETIGRQIQALKAGGSPAAAPAPAQPTTRAAPAASSQFEQFLDDARRRGMERAESGLMFRIAKPGAGPRPTPDDTVIITFQVGSPDAPRGLPQLSAENVKLKVADLMPGLAEGVQMLAVDGAAMLVVPPELSYGSGAWPAGVAPGTPLMIGVQLHDIVPASDQP